MGFIDGELEKKTETDSVKVIDDSIRFNAQNASGVGLEVRVTRVYDDVGVHNRKDPCEWCMRRAGENMTYQEAYEKGSFERHDGCGCVIEYVSARGVKTYQTGKSSPNNWLSEDEFKKRVNYGLDERSLTPQERNINAAIEMQVRDKRSLTLADAIVDNHEALRFYTPEEMKHRFEQAGYKVETLSESISGFNDLTLEEGGGFIVHFGNDGLFQYHPAGGIHGEAYWKIRNGTRGKHWYDTEGKERFFGKGHRRMV